MAALLGVGILGATSLATFMVMRAPASRPPAMPSPAVYATAFSVPPRVGKVEVRITPGTEVAVDGKVVGRTPLKALVLEAGEHTLVLSHPRYGRAQRRIKVTPGETTTVEVDLRPQSRRR
ncbi:MAG TPA: PEGA domain-containing protein [Candidatus Limnocylindrales bacterium]|nr:PEGA domain-containing protein [Candidatus Limnocylindrales bacterium]